MRMTIAAIGRLKLGPERQMADDYITRIEAMGRKVGITKFKVMDWAESQKPDASQRMAEEFAAVWLAAPDGAFVIALDERGKAQNSELFATSLRHLIDGGKQDIVFLLGGPDGHAHETRDRADQLLAFGPMTWPHRLARVMLLEQIYRSLTILVNHPYHRA